MSEIVQALFEQQVARRRELINHINAGIGAFIEAHAAWPIIPIEPPLILEFPDLEPPRRLTLSNVREERTLDILLANGQQPHLESVWRALEPWLIDLLPTSTVAPHRSTVPLVGEALESERTIVGRAMVDLQRGGIDAPRLSDVATIVARLKNASSVDAIRRWLDRHPEVTQGFGIRRNLGSRTQSGHVVMSETGSETRSESPKIEVPAAPH
jgi:hypothetical protein